MKKSILMELFESGFTFLFSQRRDFFILFGGNIFRFFLEISK